jgi:hypothetical protein
MLDRVLPKNDFDKSDSLGEILWQARKQDRKNGGFRKTTSGVGSAILSLLRDRETRDELLAFAPELSGSDETCARSLAIGLMLGNLGHMLDAAANRRLAEFEVERRKARTLRELGPDDYTEDADRHASRAMRHLLAADLAHATARYIGWSLERDFGVRAPRLVAKFVTRAFQLTPAMNERQARYLCGWERATPPKTPSTDATYPG